MFTDELKDIVGSDEILGWDLDADEQISDSEMMEVDQSIEKTNQPKVMNLQPISSFSRFDY